MRTSRRERGSVRWIALLVLAAAARPALVAPHPARAATGEAPAIRHGIGPSLKADFNGDGFADLALSAFAEDVGTVENAGVVHVLYGSAAGLTATNNQLWSQDSPGILDQAETDDLFGRALASGDFNGDGFADLAIGVGHESFGPGVVDAGAVNVIYGSAAGLTAAGNQFWTQDSPEILDQTEAHDNFGRSVDAGDFNGDGFADLAIGAAYEGVDGVDNTGAVNVIYGSAAGLTADGNQFWSQNSPGILDESEPNERFGWAVTANDFNGDGFADLGIGNPGEDSGGVAASGAVAVLYGSAGGLTSDGNQLWSQDSPGIIGDPALGDFFGRAVRSADFNGDGFADLAAGIPSKDVDGIPNSGACQVIYGSAAGLVSDGNQVWSQNSPGIQGRSESDDHFCRHLGVGDFNGDGFQDLSVGVVSENVGNVKDAGAVNVIYGSAAGLTSDGNLILIQGRDGILGVPEKDDALGRAASGFDFNGDGFDDLAAGAPGDHVNGLLAAGAVNVVYGSASGLTATGNQLWNEDSPDVLGDPQLGALFGAGFPGLPAGGCGRGGDCTDS